MCGVVRAEAFPELSRTQEWLARGFAGEMEYLHDSRRGDPRGAMPGTQSVIVCALTYNTGLPRTAQAFEEITATLQDGPRGWISRYAWGDEYHEVMRDKLEALQEALRNHISEPFEARTYADTGPINERVLAKHAGLGWLGKNTLLLNERTGSFFFSGSDFNLSGFAAIALCCRLASSRSLRNLQKMFGCLSHGRSRRALSDGRAEMHLLFDHRTARPRPAGSKGSDGAAHIWLRYLSGRLPVESQRTRHDGKCIPTSKLQFATRHSRPRHLLTESRTASLHERSGVSRDISKQPSEAHEMERPDSQCLYRAGKFQPAGCGAATRYLAPGAPCRFRRVSDLGICPMGYFAHRRSGCRAVPFCIARCNWTSAIIHWTEDVGPTEGYWLRRSGGGWVCF